MLPNRVHRRALLGIAPRRCCAARTACCSEPRPPPGECGAQRQGSIVCAANVAVSTPRCQAAGQALTAMSSQVRAGSCLGVPPLTGTARALPRQHGGAARCSAAPRATPTLHHRPPALLLPSLQGTGWDNVKAALQKFIPAAQKPPIEVPVPTVEWQPVTVLAPTLQVYKMGGWRSVAARGRLARGRQACRGRGCVLACARALVMAPRLPPQQWGSTLAAAAIALPRLPRTASP